MVWSSNRPRPRNRSHWVEAADFIGDTRSHATGEEERPELRQRVGREWTKTHYQNHRRERAGKFVKEKIAILDRLMSSGGYGHLILAGHPAMTRRVQEALPKHLQAKLVGLVPGSGRTSLAEIVETTLAAFIEAEERESLSAVEVLDGQIRTGGLAVAGTEACLLALRRGQVDMLILARDSGSESGYTCTKCGSSQFGDEAPLSCQECSCTALHSFNVREEMARLAELSSCRIEVVKKSDALDDLGGVGCLIRYRLAEEFQQPTPVT